MNPTFFIARRYLFAPKSHNAINLISLVSAVGVAVGTFALVVVMSVYNGMDTFVAKQQSILSPTLKITPAKGKVFLPTALNVEQIKNVEGVSSLTQMIEENALLRYGEKQHIAVLCGTDDNFIYQSGLADNIVDGAPILQQGDVRCAIVGQGVAQILDLRPQYIDLLWIYVPQRGRQFSALNMDDALNRAYVRPTGIFSVEWESNSKYVFVPLALMQGLLNYKDGELGSIGLYLHPNADQNRIQQEIQRIAGSNFTVKNKDQQNEMLYKMMQSEKWVIFFILAFVLLIASFNSAASLAMLIIEKKKDIGTLRAMGAQRRQISRIFTAEGMMISSVGCVVGVVLALIACLAQIRFGIIKLTGNFMLDAYPVDIRAIDIVFIVLTVTLINYLTAHLPVRSLIGRKQYSE
jgi:lipoprotein-releasing system permease protein